MHVYLKDKRKTKYRDFGDFGDEASSMLELDNLISAQGGSGSVSSDPAYNYDWNVTQQDSGNFNTVTSQYDPATSPASAGPSIWDTVSQTVVSGASQAGTYIQHNPGVVSSILGMFGVQGTQTYTPPNLNKPPQSFIQSYGLPIAALAGVALILYFKK